MARRSIRFAAIFLLALTGALLTPDALRAGNIHEEFGVRYNDVKDPYDDQAVTYRERWDPSFLPVRFYLYHDPLSGAVLDDQLYPPSEMPEFQPFDIQRHLVNSLKAWNNNPLSTFAFDTMLDWAENAPKRLGNDGSASFYYPTGSQFDGINLLSFWDNSGLAMSGGVIGVTSMYILNKDWNVLTQGKFPYEVIDSISTVIGVDFDEDGVFDVYLPNRPDGKFRQGEILDADIIMNPALTDWRSFPDDPSKLTDQYSDILGIPDVQAVFTHELGHAHGVAHASIFSSTMEPALNVSMRTTTGALIAPLAMDPYEQRTPNYDDQVSQALQYPAAVPPSLGGLAGQVLDGDFIDTDNNAPHGGEPSDQYILQVPVYACVPAGDTTMNPDYTIFTDDPNSDFILTGDKATFASDPDAQRIPFKRLCSVATGLDISIPLNGTSINAPSASYSSDFYIPGLPVREDLALFVDNPGLADWVNGVMGQMAPATSYFFPEFYGGANMPGLGSGYVSASESTGDDKFGNNYIECAIDLQGRYSVGVPARNGSNGLPLISGFSII